MWIGNPRFASESKWAFPSCRFLFNNLWIWIFPIFWEVVIIFMFTVWRDRGIRGRGFFFDFDPLVIKKRKLNKLENKKKGNQETLLELIGSLEDVFKTGQAPRSCSDFSSELISKNKLISWSWEKNKKRTCWQFGQPTGAIVFKFVQRN